MPLFRAAVLAALALALSNAGGSAAEPPTDAAPGSWDGVTVQVGPVTGDPEKDSVGLARGDHDDCGLVPLFARDVVLHGPPTGDPEKDSLGLRVAGQYDNCDGAIR